MDFRVSQQWGTAFCYVLPLSSTRALVEYTLFSPALLQPSRYEEGLQHYIHDILKLADYTVADEEFGVIPMTDYRFPVRENKLVHIGTAGGQTKGSSGYTFRNIQKHSAALVKALRETGSPNLVPHSARFDFYDSILLRILHHGTVPGQLIFERLFGRNKPQKVLQFLDNDTGLRDEVRMISTLPTVPFLKAAIRHFTHR
jgi:lycopene beta-cyclase